MEHKKTNAPKTTITRNISDLEKSTGNIYEAIAVLAKRANQINNEIKQILDTKLNEFSSSTDNLEEIFDNPEQIEVSKYFEQLPKPTAIATQEWLEGKIYYRNNKNERKEKNTE